MQALASLASQNSAFLDEFTQVAFFTLRFQKQSAGMGTAATAAQPRNHTLTKSYRAIQLECYYH